jgi:glycosyltransferase involved in cell wall biosynthesis
LDPGSPADRDFRLKIEKAGIKECVDLRSRIPNSEMPRFLSECDAGIITYGRTSGNGSLPNRLFEYMAAGLPVIAPSYAKEIVNVLEEERCGLTVDAENPEALAEAIVFLKMNPEKAREMGGRAREGFIQRHNWDVEVSPLIRRIREWAAYRRPG